MANWTGGAINPGYTVVNGSLSGSANNKVACWLEYKVISQSITNNTSTIRVYAYLATATGTKYWTYWNNHTGDTRGMFKIYAGGSLVYEREKRGFATSNVPTRTDFTTQYETAYSSAENKKYITVLTDNASTRSAAYGDFTVAHNSDGTKQITLSFSGNFSIASTYGTASGSITVTLPTIPRSTTPTVGSLTMGSAGTISLSPASSSFTHTLRYLVGSASATIVTKTSSTSVSWTPPLSLASQVPSATTAIGTLYCDTYNGSTLIGTKSVGISLAVPSSVVPTLTYTMQEGVSGLAAKIGAYVQSKSKLKVTITPSGAYGSTIASVTTTVNDATYTSTSFTTAELNGSGTKTMKIVVKDSRGRTATTNVSYSVLAYSAPSLSGVSVYRCNSSGAASHTGTYVAVTLTGAVTALNNRNDVAFKVGYKRKTATDYTVTTLSTSGYSVSSTRFIVGGSLSNQYAYDIRVEAKDYFSSTYAYGDISTANTIMSIRNNGLGLAIGKISEKNLFEVGWDAEFAEDVEFKGDVTFSDLSWLRDLIYPVGSIRMTTSTTGATTFMGGTWVLWGAGRVPIGVNSQDTDFSAAEKTGGAKTVTLATGNLPSHSHTLSSGTVTVASGGAHTHTASKGSYKVGSGSGSTYKYFTNGGSTEPQTIASSGSHSHTATLSGSTGTAGSGTAVNKLPPYITCYMYKRTA